MKKSWAKKWVKALRSGKYEQTAYHLKDQYGYCCLGVLCTLTEYKNNYTKMISTDEYKNTTQNNTLPDKVKELVGMKNVIGSIHDDVALTSMNDSGKSFKWIANYIEKNWKKL